MTELNKVTTNRFVGFIDILGFKNLVDNNTHQKVLNLLESLKGALNKIDERERQDLKTWIFSDSILIVSKDDSYRAADAIMISVSQIIEHSLKIGLLVKGVISHGKFTADFDNSIFFGKPLIDSYLLQEEIKVSSIVLHHTFEKKVLSFKEPIELFKGKRTIQYITPLQRGFVTQLHLNWMQYHSIHSSDSIDQKKEKTNRHITSLKEIYLTVSGYSRIYIDNTIKFLETCKSEIISE